MTWWRRRSLRVRLTVLSTAVLAVGLAVGSLVLAELFVHARLAAVDAVANAEATTVALLVQTGDLPSPLPAPAAGTALAQVVDPAGTVLAATASASRVLAIVPVPPEKTATGDRTFTTRSSTLGSAPLRVVIRTAQVHGTPVEVIAAVPIADVTSTLDALRRVLLFVVPIVLLATAAATWLAVGSALRPVDELRTEAEELESSGSSDPPQLRIPDGADELRRLGTTLNRMLGRLHIAGEQQRAFIADAAHELRSPIASLQTQLEVALATSPTAEQWPGIAADVLTDVERLGSVAADLLLLARLDAKSQGPLELVDLGHLIDPAGASILVRGNDVALRRLLDNLQSNAARHATEVCTSIELEADYAVVTVDDNGPGIAVADRDRVFDRWVRLDEGRSRDDGGSGLGLSIARSIARHHGGDITLDASPLGGLRAQLRIPSAAAVGPGRPVPA
jgi:signal transduction histidine kinase